MAAAQQNQSPMLVLGGAPRRCDGAWVRCRRSTTCRSWRRWPTPSPPSLRRGRRPVDDAAARRSGAVRVAFVDFRMDHVFGEAHDRDEPGRCRSCPAAPPPDGLRRQMAVDLAAPQRPVIVAGTNVWVGATPRTPCCTCRDAAYPGVRQRDGRGIVGADRDLAFSRAAQRRSRRPTSPLVVGVPMDFGSASAACSATRPSLSSRRPGAADREAPRAVAAGSTAT